MKKAAFIIVYFGRFNNYFSLFLKSCAYNPEFDWFIFTDDRREFNYPPNVYRYYMNFDEIKVLFQVKFGFHINLKRPYKLCDFKVAYGYVFSDYLKKYNMWGYCDTDILFGKLSHFITDDDVELYDKIGILGHCTLYRNTAEVNTLFMKKLHGKERYKEVFQSLRNHSFDEEFNNSINNIFEQEKKKIRYKEYQANIYTKSSNFKLTNLNSDKISYSVEKLKKNFFVWDNGKLLRYILDCGQIKINEYMYIHMQSRLMRIRFADVGKVCKIKIIPNSFELLEVNEVTEKNFNVIRRKYFNLHYFRLRSHNLYIKLKRKLGVLSY